MKLVNCEIKVPKKYQEMINEIEYVAENKMYSVKLNDGFMFTEEVEAVTSKKAVLDLIKTVVEKPIEIVDNTKLAVESLGKNLRNQIKTDFSAELISLYPTEAYKNYNPMLSFDMSYGENGKKLKTFQSNGTKFYIKSKGRFEELNGTDEISVYVQNENFKNVNAIEVLKVVYSYHKTRSYANSLRKSKVSIEELIQQEVNRQNEKLFNEIDDKLKSKIVYEFIVNGDSVDELNSKYENVEIVLNALKLNDSYRGNFKGFRNGAVLSSLRGAKRFDLQKLVELYLYGLNTNTMKVSC